MSYILDALRDSQQQREGGPVPGLLTEHRREAGNGPATSSTVSRSLWGVVLAVVVGGAAGWWFATGGRAPDSSLEPGVNIDSPISLPSPATTPAADGIARVGADGANGEDSDEASSLPAPAATVVDAGGLSGEDSGVSPGDEAAVEGVGEDDISVQPGPGNSRPEPTAASASDRSLVRQMAEDLESRWVGAPATTQAEEINDDQGDGQMQSEPVEPEQEPVPGMRQLPLEIQQQVDWIRFSVHLYAPDPRRRLVKINGLVFREGSEVGNGATIESITPTGAIFVYGDYRFSVRVQ